MKRTRRFTLDSTPLTSREIDLFQEDIKSLGLDRQVLLLLNRLPLTYTADSIPKVLRAYEEDRLCGVAWIMECRKCFQYLLPGWFGKFMDMPRLPIFMWGRKGVCIDGFNNPGFVAGGLDRETFFGEAIHFLTRKYMNGMVVTGVNDLRLPWALELPFVDNGYIDAGENTLEDFLVRRQNLRRKIRKFANKGGEIRVLKGSLPENTLSVLSRCLSDAEENARAKMPFQDIYNPLAIGSLSNPELDTVHILALLEGKIVGYQSFLHSGADLHCLSGGFDRSHRTTYHAYENIILESIRYAGENGSRTIHYGPIFNPTKIAMMQYFSSTRLCFYTRHAWLRAGIPTLIRNSKLSVENLEKYMDLQEKSGMEQREGKFLLQG